MKNYAWISLIVGIFSILFGSNIFATEPSIFRWAGLLAIVGGVAILLRGWVAISIHYEVDKSSIPWWSIKKVLE